MPEPNQFKEIIDRKIEHLKIPLEYDVQHSENYFKYIKLVHHSLPEIDFNEIDLSTKFFNKKISAPICISAITGGHPISQEINIILSSAAEAENIIMSVGSQRIGLEDPSTANTFNIVREAAPNVSIIGNIGVGQVSSRFFDVEDFNNCIRMINADAMAIHFNALHELLQNNGNVSFSNFYSNFQKIRETIKIPIIAKEVGTGFNKELAQKLDQIGFDGFDVGGVGGTSFAAIEAHRNNGYKEKYTRNPADIFREWGIPTPVSILNIREITQKLIIASGGLRSGLDIAKSLVIGADLGGFAYNFLKSAWSDYEENSISHTIKEIKTLKNELRSCLWLMNVRSIENLKNKVDKRIFLGKLYQWINQK
jgi:isopentenyl-diphosphate delta-isomerase